MEVRLYYTTEGVYVADGKNKLLFSGGIVAGPVQGPTPEFISDITTVTTTVTPSRHVLPPGTHVFTGPLAPTMDGFESPQAAPQIKKVEIISEQEFADIRCKYDRLKSDYNNKESWITSNYTLKINGLRSQILDLEHQRQNEIDALQRPTLEDVLRNR